jgi:PAS domain S-box-containing protein
MTRPRLGENSLQLARTLSGIGKRAKVIVKQRGDALSALHESETLYRSALALGRMVTWETDLVSKTRRWTPEAEALFGLQLTDGQGSVGGDSDEYRRAVHPDDRHLIDVYHALANKQDTFEAEYRIVNSTGDVRWVRGHGQVTARTDDGSARRLVNIVTDVTDQKAAEERVRLLVGEISHRSKNLLAVVQAIARRTADSASSIDDFQHSFGRRLQGLSASHDVLIGSNWQGAPLDKLIRQHIELFVDPDSPRFEIDGPAVIVSAEAAQAIGLAIHELATNATKYGALTAAAGRVKVEWQFRLVPEGSKVLHISWSEANGPAVSQPSRKGFGHIVITQMIERSLNGNVDLQFLSSGFSWSASIPEKNLRSPHGA